MADTLKTSHATKQFPPNIEHGSEFHLEFLYRHFATAHEEAVLMLKNLLKKSVLYIVDWEREFFLLTDASGTSMGGCLMQKDDEGNYRHTRFMSRGFDKYEQA